MGIRKSDSLCGERVRAQMVLSRELLFVPRTCGTHWLTPDAESSRSRRSSFIAHWAKHLRHLGSPWPALFLAGESAASSLIHSPCRQSDRNSPTLTQCRANELTTPLVSAGGNSRLALGFRQPENSVVCWESHKSKVLPRSSWLSFYNLSLERWRTTTAITNCVILRR